VSGPHPGRKGGAEAPPFRCIQLKTVERGEKSRLVSVCPSGVTPPVLAGEDFHVTLVAATIRSLAGRGVYCYGRLR
jgi:hypothetical protein